MRTSYLLPLLALAACDPWAIDPDKSRTVDEPLWDPAVSALSDGIYVRLPLAGKLLRITSANEWAEVDLNGASPDRIVAVPDQQSLLVTASWMVCKNDDPKIKRVEDCADSDLDMESELNLVRDGKVVKTLSEVPPQFQAFAFNKNGSIAAAFLDPNATDLTVDGILNLTAIDFIETATGTNHEVPVGFAADGVLFSDDGTKAVVLSRSQVAVVDLATWAVTVTYPLTLDPDHQVSPLDVVLARDGRYALVTVSGSSDLYVLDLEQESIDIVELSGVPSDMVMDPNSDRTILVYAGQRSVDVLEHDYFELSSFSLDEPANAIADGEGFSLLYNNINGYHDVYLFEPTDGNLIEFRAENPILKLQLTEDHRYGVATLQPEITNNTGVDAFYDQHYGLQIFPMAEDADPVALVLEGAPVGLQLVSQNDVNKALVLMEGVNKVLQVDIATAIATSVELDVAPTSIAATPDGRFVIAQNSPLGMISFLDPATGDLTTAAGFASTGLATDTDILPRRSEE